jgi:hypothetical protein
VGCQPGAIETDGPVPGVFGSEDRVVGSENVRGFNRAPGELAVEAGCTSTEGAGHAFANPSGESVRPEATRDAWEKTLRFLDEALRASATRRSRCSWHPSDTAREPRPVTAPRLERGPTTGGHRRPAV